MIWQAILLWLTLALPAAAQDYPWRMPVPDHRFLERQYRCNAAAQELDNYVSLASGFASRNQSDRLQGGKLHAEHISRILRMYIEATEELTDEMRVIVDVARCDRLRDEGKARIDAIILREIGSPKR